MLAAAPATAVQLTRACLAAGYEAVVPASWGDELVAARVVERMKSLPGPALQCSCPLVADRLSAHGEAIHELIVCTVSPVAAVAGYLRALYAPARPSITFAGGCPGGATETVDVWMSAADLFADLASRGIALGNQPTEFDTLPADRRRFYSEPGGLPARAALRAVDANAVAVEIDHADFVTSVGQHLIGTTRALVDVSTALGCACAGAGDGARAAGARGRVREHEPPRAPSAIVDHRVPVALDAELPRGAAAAVAAVPVQAVSTAAPGVREPVATPAVSLETPPPVPRRRSPPGLPRPVLGAAPRQSRADGRMLPRAYIARRRSSPRGLRTVERTGASPQRRERWTWIAAGVAAGAGLSLLMLLVF